MQGKRERARRKKCREREREREREDVELSYSPSRHTCNCNHACMHFVSFYLQCKVPETSLAVKFIRWSICIKLI